ncbi:hypothetical protein D3C71_1718090 [compost metagenome]
MQRKPQGGGRLGVGGLAALGRSHLLRAGARLAAKRRVGGQAVAATIAVRDGDGDLFAQLGRDDATPQGAERAPHAFQRRGRIGHGLEHVGRGAKGAMDLGQQRGAVGGGVAGIDQGYAGHGHYSCLGRGRRRVVAG